MGQTKTMSGKTGIVKGHPITTDEYEIMLDVIESEAK